MDENQFVKSMQELITDRIYTKSLANQYLSLILFLCVVIYFLMFFGLLFSLGATSIFFIFLILFFLRQLYKTYFVRTTFAENQMEHASVFSGKRVLMYDSLIISKERYSIVILGNTADGKNVKLTYSNNDLDVELIYLFIKAHKNE